MSALNIEIIASGSKHSSINPESAEIEKIEDSVSISKENTNAAIEAKESVKSQKSNLKDVNDTATIDPSYDISVGEEEGDETEIDVEALITEQKSLESMDISNLLESDPDNDGTRRRRTTLDTFISIAESNKSIEAEIITLASKKSLSMESYIESSPDLSRSSEISPETVERPIDRQMYVDLYLLYTKQLKQKKMINNIYQRKVSEYYTRRRMYHVFQVDPKTQLEQEKLYRKLLDEFDAEYERCTREQESQLGEVQSLRHKCKFKKEEVDTLFAKLEKKQIDYAKELNSGGDNSTEKFLERFLKRQRSVLNILIKMRLLYIKLLNKYNEAQDNINALDRLGSNFRVFDYEQLKNDNRKLSDTLEEKESALTVLRRQCQHNMQILAHTREKSFALNRDTTKYFEEGQAVFADFEDARGQLHFVKVERDNLRKDIAKLTDKGGLLERPQLLKDMEKTLGELEAGKKQLKSLQEEVKNITENIQALKKRSKAFRFYNFYNESIAQDSM